MLTTKPAKRDKPPSGGDDVYDLDPISLPSARRRSPSVAPRPKVGLSESFEEQRAPTSRTPLGTSVLVFFLGAASFWYSMRQDVLLGQITIPIMTLTTLHGLWRGGFRLLLLLAVLGGASYFAYMSPGYNGPLIQRVTGSSSATTNGIIVGSLALVVRLGVSYFGKRFRRKYISTQRFALFADRLAGTSIGLAEGASAALCICWMAVLIQPIAVRVRDHQDVEIDSLRHRVATTMITLADEANTGRLGSFVRKTNLLEKSPVLRKALEDMSTTGQMDLDNLSPELQDLLRRLTPHISGIEKYERGNESRSKAYKQLPPASSSEDRQ